MLSRPMIDRIAFLGISWYAILIVAAILIGLAFCTREARRLHAQVALHHHGIHVSSRDSRTEAHRPWLVRLGELEVCIGLLNNNPATRK